MALLAQASKTRQYRVIRMNSAASPRALTSRPSPHNSAGGGWGLPLLTTLLAACTLTYGIGGLYRLDAYSADRMASFEGKYWLTFYAPPHWILLCLVTLLALLSLSLVWRKPRSLNSSLLGLYVSLVASGYGFLITSSSSPIFEPYLNLMKPMLEMGIDRRIVRAGGNILMVTERVLWLGAWAFAGAVCVHFCTRLLHMPKTQRRLPDEVTALLAAWAFMGAVLPGTTPILIASVVLFLTGMGAVLVGARGAFDRRTVSMPILAGVIMALQLWLTTWEGKDPTLGMYASAIILLLVLPRIVSSNLLLVYAPAILLATAGTLSIEYLDNAILHILLWVGVCIGVAGQIILSSFRSLPLDTSRQALWLLSGFMLAGIFAITWRLAIMLGDECSPSSTSTFCYYYRYVEWLFASPLLILLAFFVIALQYRGHIDAARFFRRTTVYGTLAVLSIFAFGVLESSLQRWLGDGLPSGTPPVIAAGTLAVVLHPAKKLCDRLINPLLSKLLGWADAPTR